jgi:hypothetical protein
VTPRDRPPQGTTLTDKVFLADELVQRPGPHAGSERLSAGRRLEERLGLGAA